MSKQLVFEQEARMRMKAGIDQVAQAVRITMGPKGRNAILEKGYGGPAITNDGVSIAKDIELEDKFENIGAQVIQEVAQKTNEMAGDGTTAATVLMQAVVSEGMRTIGMGANPMSIKRGMEEASRDIQEALDQQAKDISDSQEIAHVASVSAESAEMGATIAQTIEKVGHDGVVSVEESQTMGIESEVVEGLEFNKGYVSPYMVSDSERMEAVVKNPHVLVTDKSLSSMQEILPLLEKFVQSGAKDLVIIADDISGDALANLILNKIRGAMNIVGVKAPGFGDDKQAELQDIAVTVGATVVSKDLNMKFEEIGLEVLGQAGRIVATKDKTVVVDGKGDKQMIADRVGQLKAQLSNTEAKFAQEKIHKRISKLSGGVAVLRVGAATEAEMKYLKDKIDDAVNATKAAIAHGVVAGGGSALLKVKTALAAKLEKMKGEEQAGYAIVLQALEAPLRQIAQNAGEDDGVIVSKVSEGGEESGYNAQTGEVVKDMFVAGVIDPVLVTKAGVIHACSAASVFLTTEVAIADNPEKEEVAPPMGGMPGMM